MQYIDSNVFLYSTLYSPDLEPKAKRAKEILQKIENKELPAATSTLTWDEVVWVATKLLDRRSGVTLGQKLLGFPNLEFISVDENIIAQAQSLMDKYKLTPRDSIHAASALSRKATIIISDDEDFDQIKEIKRTPLK